MKVVFDASVLIFLLERDANAPVDPDTGSTVTRCYDRVNYLIADLKQKGAKILIPTPVLAEVLVKAGTAAPAWLEILGRARHIAIAPFDTLAAIEHAALQNTRAKPFSEEKRKIKFDDQIIAIARVSGAKTIYSSDHQLARKAGEGISVYSVKDLPLPPEDPQQNLFD